jgi:hypothetical protein
MIKLGSRNTGTFLKVPSHINWCALIKTYRYVTNPKPRNLAFKKELLKESKLCSDLVGVCVFISIDPRPQQEQQAG